MSSSKLCTICYSPIRIVAKDNPTWEGKPVHSKCFMEQIRKDSIVEDLRIVVELIQPIDGEEQNEWTRKFLQDIRARLLSGCCLSYKQQDVLKKMSKKRARLLSKQSKQKKK